MNITTIFRFLRFKSFLMAFVLAALVSGVNSTTHAGVYESPLAGRNKVDWFIGNLKDHGDGTIQRDYMGGFQTYIGHGGMDLWAYDFKAMDEGIDVLAAAPGIVQVVDDRILEMWPGVNYFFPSPYILVGHADGTRAFYYHVRHDSSVVTQGQEVVTGQKLAIMGPHLHFEVQDAAYKSLEIMTNEAGQGQSFDWFDSYSNQAIRQVLGMGITKTNDVLLLQDLTEQTPMAYTRIHSGTFSPWIKCVGLSSNDLLTIRLVVESGPGWDMDLTDWPMWSSQNVKWTYCYWYVWRLVDGTTYRMQYRWNGGEWTDPPGNPLLVVDDSADEEYVSRYSPHYTRYVSAGNPTAQAPYTSWATAAATIQDAIDVSQTADLVIVADGVYDAGGAVIQGTMTRVAVNKAISVRSANGPHKAIIMGNGPMGPDAVRCAYVCNSALFGGFTLTNGAVNPESGTNAIGGGLLAGQYGGVANCIISGCAASNGGGVAGGNLNNCLVVGNTASGRGGGTFRSALGNSTIADNTAATAGGCFGGNLYSCISWHNTTNGQPSNFEFEPDSWVYYSCVTPAAAGSMNITNDPAFLNRSAFDYRLPANSSCVDHGLGSASWALDIDHGPRIVNFATDMGAFEYAAEPPPPWGVRVEAPLRGGMRVSWEAAPRATSYRVWRTDHTYSYGASLIATTPQLSLNDTTALPHVTYYYWIQAVNGAGASLYSASASGSLRNPISAMFACDFNADGAAEMTASGNGVWFALSASNTVTLWNQVWGYAGVQPVVGDYDGDGMSDLAVFDSASGNWFIWSLSGQDNVQQAVSHNQQSTIENQKSGHAIAWALPWGWPSAEPVSGDFDGDGISDLAVYDKQTGKWYIWSLADHGDGWQSTTHNQQSTIHNQKSGHAIAWAVPWGWPGATTVPGDFDGDGAADLAVYDNASGAWYAQRLDGGVIAWGISWGWLGATPVSGDYDGDGISDLAVYDELTGKWYVQAVNGSVIVWDVDWGWPGATPVPADYDGDGAWDLAVCDVAATPAAMWYAHSVKRNELLFWAVLWGKTILPPVTP